MRRGLARGRLAVGLDRWTDLNHGERLLFWRRHRLRNFVLNALQRLEVSKDRVRVLAYQHRDVEPRHRCAYAASCRTRPRTIRVRREAIGSPCCGDHSKAASLIAFR